MAKKTQHPKFPKSPHPVEVLRSLLDQCSKDVLVQALVDREYSILEWQSGGDLRERVLAAVEAGATPEAAARRFAVGRSTAYRWATAARVEGRRAAKRMGGGPKPRITGEVETALLDLLGEANHLTLAECRDRLAERTGVRVHPWTVGRALRRRGWT